MFLNKIAITVLSIGLMTACSSTNKKAESTVTTTTTTTTTTKENSMNDAAMIEAGFTMAEVVESKVEGDCPFTLKIVGKTTYYYDPIDMSDEFKSNGEEVWFKFAGLRRMNRCEKASPISILEMQRR